MWHFLRGQPTACQNDNLWRAEKTDLHYAVINFVTVLAFFHYVENNSVNCEILAYKSVDFISCVTHK